DFQNHLMIAVDIGQIEEKRSADVSADVGAVFLPQHLANESGCRRFALGAGHASDRRRTSLDEKPDFSGDGDVVLPRQFEITGFRRHSWRGDDQISVGKVLFAMAAEMKTDGELFE